MAPVHVYVDNRESLISPNPLMHRPVLKPSQANILRGLVMNMPPKKYKPFNRCYPRHLDLYSATEHLVRFDKNPQECRRILGHTYVHGCPTALPHIDPDLPVDVLITSTENAKNWYEYGKVNRHASYAFDGLQKKPFGFRVWRDSLVVVSPPSKDGFYKLKCAFITSATDPRLPAMLSDAPKVVDLVSRVIDMKDKSRWNAQAEKKDNVRVSGYLGSLWNEGQQSYRYGKAMAFGYFKRRPNAPVPPNYAFDISLWCAKMSCLHKSHTPGLRQHCVDVAKSYKTLGVAPGIPRDLVPQHTLGISVGFANDLHDDSTAKGHTESISYYRGPRKLKLDGGGGWGFAVWHPKIIFDLNAHHASMIYVPGRETHGTVPTSKHHQEHKGIGSVLFMRSSVLNKFWLDLGDMRRPEMFSKY